MKEPGDKKGGETTELSGKPESHPIGTGLGAIAIGVAATAAGVAAAGVIGGAIGVLAGALAGAAAGRAAAEAIEHPEEEGKPEKDEAFWRELHARGPNPEVDFEKYREVYRMGFEGYASYSPEMTFDQAEPHLKERYRSTGLDIPWDEVRDATRAAWESAEKKKIPLTKTSPSTGDIEAAGQYPELGGDPSASGRSGL